MVTIIVSDKLMELLMLKPDLFYIRYTDYRKFLNRPAIMIFKTARLTLAARNAIYTQFKSILGKWM
jgi:hypothetical protein